MDETGVHSPLNVTKPIVSGIDTTSPVQTVAGKDLSNPLMAVILPKNEHEEASSSKTRRRLPRTLTRSSSRARSNHTKKQQKNIEKIVKETLEQIFLKPQKEFTVPIRYNRRNQFSVPEDHISDTSHVSNTDPENVQEAQDPNDAYDSGMSFDSIALHNLDT
ncbi:hypothetical protein RND71_036872 [Anisodus tanguticus]|uniref:Uncharacterized protein n=1 Tax=Anisodus tanguticus TaxID=243964 RepID=A0AAE1UT49_9SOLA|nr:hypothetical protein RND71_036872 [Anisodus tanguticus]